MKIQLRLPSSFIFAISMALTACHFQDKKNTDLNTPNILFIAIDDMNDWVGALGGQDPNEWENLAENIEYKSVKEDLQAYFPKHEAPLSRDGIFLHNVTDADRPSLDGFIKVWNSLKEEGMNLD